ncbi:MAG: AAA family ATPase [Desulfocapsa sp.]|nr:AAA family ATPase [Desulfocapsa sp.]
MRFLFFKVCHYLNFEEDEQLDKIFRQDLKPVRILKELEFYFDRLIEVNEDILIFDEVQASPRALNSLKYFQEKKADLAIVAAGSLLGVELSEISFPVGKVEFLDMHPLSFGEFLAAVGDHSSSDFFRDFKKKSEDP